MRKLILSILFYCFSTALFSQDKTDVGGFIGAASYLGEIGGKDKTRRGFVFDMKLMQTRWAMGVFGRRLLSPLFSANAGFSYARIQGADSLSTNPGRRGRNLSFRNDFYEISLKLELYILQNHDIGGIRRKRRKDFSLYGFAGAAIIYHNPKAKYNNTWIALQPLRTEGKKYSKIQPAFPIGAGFYLTYSKRHRVGLEGGWRITFTDDLDDVSTVYADSNDLSGPIAVALANRNGELNFNDPTIASMSTEYTSGSIRGNPKNNDSYIFFEITYSYAIKPKPKFNRKKFSCN